MEGQEGEGTDLKAFLGSVGISPERIDEVIDVLTKAETREDLLGEFTTRHFGVDEEQFLLPLFRPIYEHFPEVREATLNQLETVGVPRELADQYFVGMGDQPYSILFLKYGEIVERSVAKRFVDEARRVMFKTLREQLGIVS